MLLDLIGAAGTLVVSAVAVVILNRAARQIRVFFFEAHESGYRQGLREAIRIADVRGDIAAELAPKGKLGTGLLRAQIAREVSLELRDLLDGVR